eukprot:365194-Chlamydomonas_euryale.AAC.5
MEAHLRLRVIISEGPAPYPAPGRPAVMCTRPRRSNLLSTAGTWSGVHGGRAAYAASASDEKIAVLKKWRPCSTTPNTCKGGGPGV